MVWACVVDILCGGLSGSGYGAVRSSDTVAHTVAAYNIEAFLDVEDFKSMMDEWLQTLKDTPPSPGNERVLVAGQMEWEAEQDRSSKGIPLHVEVVQWFRDTCSQMEIPFILEGRFDLSTLRHSGHRWRNHWFILSPSPYPTLPQDPRGHSGKGISGWPSPDGP